MAQSPEVKQKQRRELVFTLFLAAYGLVLLIETPQYSPAARLFPYVVLLSLGVFLLLKFGTWKSPRLKEILEPPDLFGASDLSHVAGQEPASAQSDLADVSAASRHLPVYAGFGLFTAAILLFGLHYSIPPFLLLYSRFIGKRTWAAATALAVLTSAILYVVFIVLLGMPIHRGLLRWSWE